MAPRPAVTFPERYGRSVRVVRMMRLTRAQAALAAGLLTVLLAAGLVPLAVIAHENPVTTATEALGAAEQQPGLVACRR
jgi:hypothetical protein